MSASTPEPTCGPAAESLREVAFSTLVLECDCSLEAVRAASIRGREHLVACGLNEDEAAGMELALVEAVNNAVEHSGDEAREQPVRIEVAVGATGTELRIFDHTPGFDWPEEAELPDADSEDGRGLFLIQALMDRVTYFRARRGNCLVLTKAHGAPLAPKAAPEPAAPAQSAEVAVALKQTGELRELVEDLEATLSGMTEELGYSYETLTSIFRYSAELASSQNLGDFAERLLRDLTQIAEADWAVLRLFHAEKKELAVYRTVPHEVATELALLNLGSSEAAAKSGMVELETATGSKDVWWDRPLQGADPLTTMGAAGTGICHPLWLNAQLLGTLALGRSRSDAPFRAAQVNVLHTLADFLAIQIANDRFLQERMQSQVVRRELDIAASIQRSLLPTTIPEAAPFSLATSCESAREIGGDFFDIIAVDQRGLLFVIADVMGKGVPAALLAAILRSVIRSMPQSFDRPADLLSAVNHVLYEDFSRVDMFATALVAFVDRQEGKIVAASAGHCPILIFEPGQSDVRVIEASGPPLGVSAEELYEEETAELGSRARVLLYTDGVTELLNPEGEMYTDNRLRDWMMQPHAGAVSAEDFKRILLEELSGFQGGQTSRDDQTFVMITREK